MLGVPQLPPLNIEAKNIQTAPGVSLTEQQRTIVGSVLDLFAGRPSLRKLALWRDDATFTDPITIATGRDKYSAQWYGLQKAFREIEIERHTVTSAANPILMELRNRYVIRGIGKEQTIDSVVAIYTDASGKIQKVEDRWNGKLPEASVLNVSPTFLLLSPLWWMQYCLAWAFWFWSWTWETKTWRVALVSANITYCGPFLSCR
jgi:hypothetical protein